MTIFQALLFGVVEGVSEFLPISSTAHLLLTASALGLPTTEFQKSFDIIIQLGAILAVVVLYWRRFFDWELLGRLAVGFLPTGVIGFTLYPFLKTYLLGNNMIAVAALALGGLFLILFERWHQGPQEASVALPSWRQAFVIGLFQSVAMVPGVSRSAATIVGGLLLGLSRPAIVEFSFLLAVPTMMAATGLDLLKNYETFSTDQIGVLGVGFAVSFVVALATIKWLLKYVQRHNFTPFGVYRIIVAIVFSFVLLT